MSKNAKIALAIIGGLVVVCCLGVVIVTVLAPAILGPAVAEFADQNFADTPEEVAQIGQEIVSYELPAGYEEQFGMSFLGVKMVAIVDDSQNSAIVLMEFPNSMAADQEAMRQQLQQTWSQQGGSGNLNTQFVTSEEVTIRDQTVTLSTYEGTDEQGTEVRQVIGVFEGENGLVMIMAVAPLAQWDEESFDEFIASLK